MRRLFIAIRLPDDVRRLLVERSALLRRRLHDVKWVEEQNLHLTLKFLGNTPEEQVADILTAMRLAVAEAAPLQLALSRFGAFPSLLKPRVLWAGLGGDVREVAELAGRLEELLEPLGFEPERRPFRAHLTIGRVRRNGRLPSLERHIAALDAGEEKRFYVRTIDLVESTLTRSGPIYQTLEEVPLLGTMPDSAE